MKLKLSAITAIFLLATITQSPTSTASSAVTHQQPLQVLVIGAGSSGIAAATKLSKHGISVIILEAEARTGGRIHSVQFGDAIVDMGAEWCHGETGNAVFEVMNNSGILTHANYTSEMRTSDGKVVEQHLFDKFEAIFEQLYEGAINATEDDSMGSYFMREYNRTMLEIINDPREMAFAQIVVQVMRNNILSLEGAFDWYDPSGNSDYQIAEGDHSLTWDGKGYATFLETLMNGFNQTNILLDRKVRLIEIDDDLGLVNVTTTRGEMFQAEHVIFTPSVGVLKNSHKQLFQPKLSDEKIEAIESIGIEGVMKVMLHYPARWWSKEANFSQVFFIWKQEDIETLTKDFPKGPRKNHKSWLMNIFSIIRLEKNPNVLSCWIAGEFVPEIEKLDDETLIDGITFVLNKFFANDYNVLKPDTFLRTKWYANPHFSGTYSFQTIRSRRMKQSANALLGKPILDNAGVPRILFAGEATHPHFYSTVHGAAETGWREADRIIKLRNN